MGSVIQRRTRPSAPGRAPTRRRRAARPVNSSPNSRGCSMATISRYQNTSGATRYRVRYRTPERGQTQRRGFKTKRDAEAFAATVEVSKLKGEYVAPALGRVRSTSWPPTGSPARNRQRRRRTIGCWNRPTALTSGHSGGAVSVATSTRSASKRGSPRWSAAPPPYCARMGCCPECSPMRSRPACRQPGQGCRKPAAQDGQASCLPVGR